MPWFGDGHVECCQGIGDGYGDGCDGLGDGHGHADVGAAGSKLGPDLGRLSAFPTLVTHSTPQTQSDRFALLPDDDAPPSMIMLNRFYVEIENRIRYTEIY